MKHSLAVFLVLTLTVILAVVANCSFNKSEPPPTGNREGQSWCEFTNELSGPVVTNLRLRMLIKVTPIGEL